ncbi:MAG: flavin reductase [Bacilli bacterium]|nr:flavin reductase [Bacilli bacterium]
MKKSIGACPALFPMPVQMIATYNDDGSVDLMNAAWGGILDSDLLILSLDSTHRTSDNIKKRKAFTLSIADETTIKESDYVGMVSENLFPGKFLKTGLSASKSEKVDAPIVNEYKLTLECEVEKISDDEMGFFVYARIKDVLVDESILDPKGKVDVTKLKPIMFDQFKNGYYSLGEKAGQAWDAGKPFLKK